jgi:cytidyltransferase-like protein
MDTKRYAIYGGSFDPIHIGHVALADHAVKECGIDKLIINKDSDSKEDTQNGKENL